MSQPRELFNPLLHITAGQLRGCGVDIKMSIPDCAWVPRDSIDIKCDGVERSGDSLLVDLSIAVCDEFKWTAVEIGKATDQIIDCPKHGKVRELAFSNDGRICGQCFCEALAEAGAEFRIKERKDDEQG